MFAGVMAGKRPVKISVSPIIPFSIRKYFADLGLRKSASIKSVLWPAWASAILMFRADVVFPSPGTHDVKVRILRDFSDSMN